MDDGAHVIIEPLDVPTPQVFADNQYLKYEIFISIETWSKKRLKTKEIADRIEAILWDKGLAQVGGLDEYDEGIFRDARRYRGAWYRESFLTGEFGKNILLEIYTIARSSLEASLSKSIPFGVQSQSASSIEAILSKIIEFKTAIQANSSIEANLAKWIKLQGDFQANSQTGGTLDMIPMILLSGSSLDYSHTEGALGITILISLSGSALDYSHTDGTLGVALATPLSGSSLEYSHTDGTLISEAPLAPIETREILASGIQVFKGNTNSYVESNTAIKTGTTSDYVSFVQFPIASLRDELNTATEITKVEFFAYYPTYYNEQKLFVHNVNSPLPLDQGILPNVGTNLAWDLIRNNNYIDMTGIIADTGETGMKDVMNAYQGFVFKANYVDGSSTSTSTQTLTTKHIKLMITGRW